MMEIKLVNIEYFDYHVTIIIFIFKSSGLWNIFATICIMRNGFGITDNTIIGTTYSVALQRVAADYHDE